MRRVRSVLILHPKNHTYIWLLDISVCVCVPACCAVSLAMQHVVGARASGFSGYVPCVSYIYISDIRGA